MDDQILDQFEEDPEIKKPVTFRQLFPLFLLWMGIFWNFYIGYLLDVKVLIAAIGLAIASFVCYLDWRKGIYIILLLTALSIFEVLTFFPVNFRVGFYVSEVFIAADLFMLLLFFIILLTNDVSLFSKVKESIYGSEEEQELQKRAEVSYYKKRYAAKSRTELMDIVDNKSFNYEARLAAKELLDQE